MTERKDLNVLLVSPRLPTDHLKYNGDNAYTDSLLNYPPDQVNYIHYQDLIKQGLARQIPFHHKLAPRLTKSGILPPDLWSEYIEVKSEFDLIHVYAFSTILKFSYGNKKIPVILSISTGSISDLLYYHNWSKKRISLSRKLKRYYLKIIKAYDTSLNPRDAALILVWSEFSKKLHLSEGYVKPDQIQVLYPGLLKQKFSSKDNDSGPVFLFIGNDFERKNGPLVVEVFKEIHRVKPSAQLILIGRPKDSQLINFPGITHLLHVSREEIFKSIYPQSDVLLLPSKGEGFGLVMLEAMSFGIPTIAIKKWAMPEIIHHGSNGFLIEGDISEGLTKYMMYLMNNPGLLKEMSRSSLDIFEQNYQIDIHNKRLRELYDQVVFNNH